MQVRNVTNNTIYAEDIDTHFPYKDGEVEEITPDTLKKSKALRGFIINGMLDIVDYDPGERIEASVIYLRDKYTKSIPVPEYTPEEPIDVTPTISSSDEIEVRLHGMFYDAGGYAKVNRNLATKLADAGIKIKVDPKMSRNQLKESELVDIIKLTKTPLSKKYINIDSVIPSFGEYSTAAYRILYTTIESYSVPDQFLECCNLYDEIWITCLVPESLIETPLGNVPLDKIQIGDEVISGSGKIEHITNKRTSAYNENIIHLTTKTGYQIKMTPTHKLFVRRTIPFNGALSKLPGYEQVVRLLGKERSKRKRIKFLVKPPEFIRADEIKPEDWVLSPKRNLPSQTNQSINILDFVGENWREKDDYIFRTFKFSRKNTENTWNIDRNAHIHKMLQLDCDVAYLFGVYAAEGSEDGNSISFVMADYEKPILINLQKTLKTTFGICSKIRKPCSSAKALELRASSRLLSEFFRNIFDRGALNKKVPSFIFTADKAIKIAFLKGAFDGDGWFCKNSINLRVISKNLRNGCVSLLLDLNLLPSISEDHTLRKNTKWNIQSRHPAYVLRLGGKQFVFSEFNRHKITFKPLANNTLRCANNHISDEYGYWHKVKNVKTILYHGEVIDIEVTGDSTFCVQSICSHNSDWSQKILQQHTDKPIYLVPAGIDHELYTENGPRFDFKPNIKDFVFISVFGWSYRKGYDVLLKAYFDEFDAHDNVSLLIVSRYQGQSARFHRNKIRDDINKIMEGFPNKDMPHVVRYSQVIPELQMPQLYRSANCFVLPSRGEGSNLCAPEASLCGLPVIMTNVSGQQQYLREDNAFLIEMDHLYTVPHGQFHLHYWDGQEFPDLTSSSVHDQLKEQMRYVYNNLEDAKKRNKNLQRLTLEKFTWNNTVNAAVKRLKAINAEMRK